MNGAQQIPVALPDLYEDEAEAAHRVILSGWVTQGPEVAAFEREFANAVGACFARATSSGTTALHLALIAVGIEPGDEVITPSHSFIASANAVRYCGATPVFIDIESDGFNLDPSLLQDALTSRTRAILCVHQIGMPCDLTRITAFARQHGLMVVEDAACAIGSAIVVDGQQQRIGRPHGDIACFSFHPRKVITTGDGGMITTNDAAMDERIRRLRQHGMSIADTTRHASPTVVFETYPEVGYNYRMTDIQAAVGRVQLRRLDHLVQRRRALAERYRRILAQIPGLRLPTEPPWAVSNWQSYCIGLPAEADQRSVMQSLLDRGIATRRGVMCAHREAAYADVLLRHPLPRSEEAQDHCIILPLYARMTEAEQDAVAAALADAPAEAVQ
jgi:dTDP-4-amino-4,6-dideoxygalactose transaminase